MADIGYIETLLTAIKDPNERLNVRRAFENILERINELEAQVAEDIADAIDAIPEPDPGVTLPIAHGDIADADGLSVFGRAANTTGEMAPIVAASDHQVFRRSGSALAFGAVDLSQAAAITGDLPFANLTQGSALSVLGVTGNATADHASIAAATDFHVLRRSGTAVAFGSLGDWTTPGFSAGDFTGSGSLTVTVDSGDVDCYQYKRLDNNTILLQVQLENFTTGGTPATEVRVAIPGGLTATKLSSVIGFARNNGGTAAACAIQTQVGVAYVRCFRNLTLSDTWANGTNNNDLYFQIVISL